MAGGMDLGSGGRSRRKPLDAAINLVPFIDLMAVTISFLIMTAVWTQVSRLQVSQSGGPPSGTPGDKELELTVLVSERGYAISADSAPYAEIPKLAGHYDVRALAQKLKALHANYPDQRQVTVRVEDKVRYLDLVDAIDACVGSKLDAVSVSAAG